MALVQEKMTLGTQEYLAWEAEQIDKHEYVAERFSPWWARGRSM